MHSGVVVNGEADCLVCQKKAHNEGQGKGYKEPGIFLPELEVVASNGKRPLYSFHNSRSLLPARMTNKIPVDIVSSSRKIAAPQEPY